MLLQKDISLLPHNTFGINVKTRYFATYSSIEELQEILHQINKNIKLLQIGCGSNLLFLKNFDGLILKSEIQYIQKLDQKQTKDITFIEVGAGIIWDDFVSYCVQHEYYGVENLSLIPGSVGASAIQNIGAYGTEAKDVIESVNCVEIATGKVFTFQNNELQYGYRTSRFKTEWNNRFIVTSVVYKLHTQSHINITYKGIKEAVEEELLKSPSSQSMLSTIRNAIIRIRKAKLPDPAQVGNVGSFFMNPIIDKKQLDLIQTQYPNIPHYILPLEKIKIPAAWLIEQCGWKGKCTGNAGVHPIQPLVLVNLGGAIGNEIADLADAIINSVYQKFNIQLKKEVIYIG